MANFTSKDVMKLREVTGVGMMDCKKALVETDGDFEAAVKYLREKGLSSAEKKAGRVASEGVTSTVVSADGKSAAIFEINCETDFVAGNDQFKELVKNIGAHTIQSKAQTAEEMLEEQYCNDKSKTVKDLFVEIVQSIGENINLRRIARVGNGADYVSSYIHMGGKISVIVQVKSDSKDADAIEELAHDLAMQIAAKNPQVVSIDNVDPAKLDEEKEILTVQARNEGRPEKIIEKIVEGRVNKYYKDVCLLEQEYIRDDSLTIKQVIASAEQKLGAKIEVAGFVRFQVGEGLEKRNSDFAQEIAEQLEGLV